MIIKSNNIGPIPRFRDFACFNNIGHPMVMMSLTLRVCLHINLYMYSSLAQMHDTPHPRINPPDL